MKTEVATSGGSYSTVLFGVDNERADELSQILTEEFEKVGNDPNYDHAKHAIDGALKAAKNEGEVHTIIFFAGEMVSHFRTTGGDDNPFAALLAALREDA